MHTQDVHQFTVQVLMSFLPKFNFMQKFTSLLTCFLHDIRDVRMGGMEEYAKVCHVSRELTTVFSVTSYF